MNRAQALAVIGELIKEDAGSDPKVAKATDAAMVLLADLLGQLDRIATALERIAEAR